MASITTANGPNGTDFYWAKASDILPPQTLSQAGNTISLSGGGGAVNVASTTAVALSTQKLTQTTYDAGLDQTKTQGNTIVFEPALAVRIEPKLEVGSELVVEAIGGVLTQIDGAFGIYTTGNLQVNGEIRDSLGNAGTSGQQVTSSGPGLGWVWGAGGGGGGVTSVSSGTNIFVDSTNPIAPIVNLDVTGGIDMLGNDISGAQNITCGTLNYTTLNPPVSAAAGGANQDIQFNNSGALGGDAGLTYNSSGRIVQLTQTNNDSRIEVIDTSTGDKTEMKSGQLNLVSAGNEVFRMNAAPNDSFVRLQRTDNTLVATDITPDLVSVSSNGVYQGLINGGSFTSTDSVTGAQCRIGAVGDPVCRVAAATLSTQQNISSFEFFDTNVLKAGLAYASGSGAVGLTTANNGEIFLARTDGAVTDSILAIQAANTYSLGNPATAADCVLDFNKGAAEGTITFDGTGFVFDPALPAPPPPAPQTLDISGDQLSISDGNTVTLPAAPAPQTLDISGYELSISDGNTVSLPEPPAPPAPQTLDISGDQLSISDGNTVTLPAAPAPQTLDISGDQLSISDGNTVSLPAPPPPAAAGADTQIQFNSVGAFAASANLTFDGSRLQVVGAIDISGATPQLIMTDLSGNVFAVELGIAPQPQVSFIGQSGAVMDMTPESMVITASGGVNSVDINAVNPSVAVSGGTETASLNAGYATASLPPTAADHLTRRDYVDGAVAAVSGIASFRPSNMYYVAKNGSDISGDGSYLNPWLTIQNAINLLEAIPVSDQTQAVINLAPGHYTENLTFTTGYIALISPYNINDVNEGCEITGDIAINITSGTDDLFNKQVILQGVQVTGTITDSSTRQHTLIIQDCYLFGANQCLWQNSSVNCRTRIYNCEVNDSTATGSTNPQIQISRGDCYMERLDCSYANNGSVLLVDVSGAVYASYCNFASSTTLSAPLLPGQVGVRVCWVTSSRASTFGNCVFQFTSTNSKTNLANFWPFRYEPPSLPGAGVSLGFCSFAPAGMNSAQSVAGSNGTGTGLNSAIIAFGSCLAAPGGATNIAGTVGVNKVPFPPVDDPFPAVTVQAASGTIALIPSMNRSTYILTGTSATQTFTSAALAGQPAGFTVYLRNGNPTPGTTSNITISINGTATLYAPSTSANAGEMLLYWNGSTIVKYG